MKAYRTLVTHVEQLKVSCKIGSLQPNLSLLLKVHNYSNLSQTVQVSFNKALKSDLLDWLINLVVLHSMKVRNSKSATLP